MSRHLTAKRITAAVVFLTTTLAPIWLFRGTEKISDDLHTFTTAVVQKPAHAILSPREEPEQLIDIFTGEDTLFYNGYEIRRLTEKLSYGHKHEVVVSYAALVKNDHR